MMTKNGQFAVLNDFGQIVSHCSKADIGYLTAAPVFADLGGSVKIVLCRPSQWLWSEPNAGAENV
jgi:hypothetical protein